MRRVSQWGEGTGRRASGHEEDGSEEGEVSVRREAGQGMRKTRVRKARSA